MLYSSPKNPFAGHRSTDYVFKANGEMKQSVGLALQKANVGGEECTDGRIMDDESIPSTFFHWRLLHTNPQMRFETIGENIPVGWNYVIHNGLEVENAKPDGWEWQGLQFGEVSRMIGMNNLVIWIDGWCKIKEFWN